MSLYFQPGILEGQSVQLYLLKWPAKGLAEHIPHHICRQAELKGTEREQLGPVWRIMRMVPSRNVLGQCARHPNSLATESLDLLFLLCSVALGTVTLKVKVKFTLHLMRVCLGKGGSLREDRKQAIPPFPLSVVAALLLWKLPQLVATLLHRQWSHRQSSIQNSALTSWAPDCRLVAYSLSAHFLTSKI